jgi:hypothetical protein
LMNVTESTGASVAVRPEDERHRKASTLPMIVLRLRRHHHGPTPCHHRPTNKGTWWVVLWVQLKGIPKLRSESRDLIAVCCSLFFVRGQSPQSLWIALWAQFCGAPKSHSGSCDMIAVCCAPPFCGGPRSRGCQHHIMIRDS